MDKPLHQVPPARPRASRRARSAAISAAIVISAAAIAIPIVHTQTTPQRHISTQARPAATAQAPTKTTNQASSTPTRILNAIRKKLADLRRRGIKLGQPDGNVINLSGEYEQAYSKGLLEISSDGSVAVAITGSQAQNFRGNKDLIPATDVDTDKIEADAQKDRRYPIVLWQDHSGAWCSSVAFGIPDGTGVTTIDEYGTDTGAMPADSTPEQRRTAKACSKALITYNRSHPEFGRALPTPGSSPTNP